MATVNVTEQSFDRGMIRAQARDELVGKVKALDLDEMRPAADEGEPERPVRAKAVGA